MKSNTTKTIRIGNQTAFMATTPLDPFQFAVTNQFDAFEWFPDKKESGAGWDLSDLSAATRLFIKETALQHGISLSVHAPLWANPLMPDAEDIFREQRDFAGNIGAKLLNIHLNTESGLEKFVRAILPLICQCRTASLRLAIENTPHTAPEDFNRLFALLHEYPDTVSDTVGMCLDLGHANLCASTRNDYIGFLDRLDPQVRLIHVHLHENYGDQDSHLVVFTGPAGQNDAGIRLFLERLAARSFDGAIILEQWPAPPDMLKTARDKVLRMLDQIEFPGKADPPAAKKNAPARKRVGLEKQLTPFAERIIEGDRNSRSWREKLDRIHTLLQDWEGMREEELVYLAIYLRYMGTGEIVCAEDGRHFRPHHHASISQQIQEHLQALSSNSNIPIMRKIYPWLPSFDTDFKRAEPLTRIRDIAHRNDIPADLKREIKHTLQNKLHRCAGPEDLVVSENILNRITAVDAQYSSDFIHQFRIFHEELLDFFNAGSLEKILLKICSQSGKKIALHVEDFLEAKAKMARNAAGQLDVIERITLLRDILGQQSGRNANVLSQNMRLADIRLENFCFVILGEILPELERPVELPWGLSLQVLVLTIDNIRLNGTEQEECVAVIAELNAWAKKFDHADRDQLLRLKATLARCQRLTGRYLDRERGVFFEKAEELGRALGVADHAIAMYCEGEIRGSLIFQLSKLNDLLLKNIRTAATLPPWDVVVSGTASGSLHFMEHLNEPHLPPGEIIAIVNRAEGDETIPKGVRGIVLAHPLPHLSHLAIRTRQEGVVLVVAEDPSQFNELVKRENEPLTFSATSDSVSFKRMVDVNPLQENQKTIKAFMTAVELSASPCILNLNQITANNCGPKAYGARQLRELSRKKDAGFNTPEGVGIPFGVMEALLDMRPTMKEQYSLLLQRLSATKEKDEFLAIVDSLAELLVKLKLPGDMAAKIVKKFGAGKRLMVRSSASCEDCAGMSGAGLYESYPNVMPDHVDEAAPRVWGSLWTRRAASSRRKAGINDDLSCMGVLIQEMIDPDYSFVMHTVNPVNRNRGEIYIEIAVGHGETLAGASEPGSPYRMVCNKETKIPSMIAYSDFSKAIWPDKKGGMTSGRIDYSAIELSTNEKMRHEIGRRLATIGCLVEEALGGPQDIEGAIAGDTIWLVQSRPQ